MRGWRNWQTRTAQDRVTERSYGFNSLPAHIFKPQLKSCGFFISLPVPYPVGKIV